MQNQDIRNEIKRAGLKLWQIADKLSLTDGNFSRKLRKEMPQEQKDHIRNIIAELRAGEN